MAITDLFSKRQRCLRGEMPDVYQYDDIPQSLRVQIVHIVRDVVGRFNAARPYNAPSIDIYEKVHKVLCKEYGVFQLAEYEFSHDETREEQEIFNFFLDDKSIEKVLDVVEVLFKSIGILRYYVRSYFYNMEIKIIDESIEELNQRFKEHGVGYQFESGEIIRVDSEFLHTEAVKPTLSLLRDKEYQGANQEFLSAHEHYRHGRHEECLVDLLKSFESTMKVICKKRNWITQPKDTASKLITILFDNNLLPSYLESEITCLRTLLESGLPTLRNKNAGHGQGAEIRTVPEYLARYALNLTASNILFLIEAESAR
jgi:hypothetical protein